MAWKRGLEVGCGLHLAKPSEKLNPAPMEKEANGLSNAGESVDWKRENGARECASDARKFSLLRPN